MIVSYVCPGLIMGKTFSFSLMRQSMSTGVSHARAFSSAGAMSLSDSIFKPTAPNACASKT